MGFTPVYKDSEYIPLRYRPIWQHHWPDGSKIILTQDKDNWILTEYDAEGQPVYYLDEANNSASMEERFSKYDWTLHDAITDIKDEYGLLGG